MSLWQRIAYLWRTPSAFRDDWRGYAVNQSGHWAVVGVLPGLLLGGAALPLIGLIYGLWELTQWQFRRASVSDCWEDWAFVMSGALFGATLHGGVLAVALGFLVAGIVWRIEEGLR